MTHGDDRKVKCPACRKLVCPGIYVGRPLPHGEILELQRPCPRCGVEVYYWFRWSVTVEAERASKVE